MLQVTRKLPWRPKSPATTQHLSCPRFILATVQTMNLLTQWAWTWMLGVSLEEKSLSPGLSILPPQGIALGWAGSRVPAKAPQPSAWKPLPSYGSMHFFPQAKEQHFRYPSQLKSVLHKSGALAVQMSLSLGHTPGFPARKTCLNSRSSRVSALLPRQRWAMKPSQPYPLPLLFSSCLVCV